MLPLSDASLKRPSIVSLTYRLPAPFHPHSSSWNPPSPVCVCVGLFLQRRVFLWCPAEQADSGGPNDPYSDASAKYGPLKLPELQAVDLSKMYGGATQVRRAWWSPHFFVEGAQSLLAFLVVCFSFQCGVLVFSCARKTSRFSCPPKG